MKLLPSKTKLFFNQKPEDKLEYIKHHQNEGAKVLMIGDGLNDAGALKQSDVGVALAENVNVFSPACDAIMDASKLSELDTFLKISKQAITIIKLSFTVSFLYNYCRAILCNNGKFITSGSSYFNANELH